MPMTGEREKAPPENARMTLRLVRHERRLWFSHFQGPPQTMGGFQRFQWTTHAPMGRRAGASIPQQMLRPRQLDSRCATAGDVILRGRGHKGKNLRYHRGTGGPQRATQGVWGFLSRSPFRMHPRSCDMVLMV